MSYYYPPPPVVPTVLPPAPLTIAGLGDTNPVNLTEGFDIYIVFVAGATLKLPLSNSVRCKRYEIKNWGATTVNIIPTSPESIDTAASYLHKVPFGNITLIPWPTVGWMIV